MKSTVTSKFQTTIPKAVRNSMAISVNDALEWTLEHGRIIVYPVRNNFLNYRNAVKIGAGSISEDIQRARTMRGTKRR